MLTMCSWADGQSYYHKNFCQSIEVNKIQHELSIASLIYKIVIHYKTLYYRQYMYGEAADRQSNKFHLYQLPVAKWY